MDAQIKNRLREIVVEAQMRVNQIATGYKVQLIEAERTKTEIEADVFKAVRERNAVGLSASNNVEVTAPATLDNVDADTRNLIEAALHDSTGIEVQK